ncbi:MAG: sugar phosphate isomerase/epimerase [Lentisphaeria bacterium]|nr:sugar phosphate isomerase/epimerase [Lentisphaeria bacterium]
MKIGALDCSLKKPLPATLKKFQEMGVQGVQIFTAPEYLLYGKERLSDIRKMCADCGLVVSAVCGDVAWSHFGVEAEWQDRIMVHERVVDIACQLGTKVITTHIGVVPDDEADPVFQMMVKSIRKAAEISAAQGTCIAVETGPEKAETLLKLLEAVDSKGLGVNLDPANLWMVSRVEADHAVRVLGKYIVHTHAKDGISYSAGSAAKVYGLREIDGTLRKIDEPRPKYEEVALGDGGVKWDAYIAELKKIGYDGFLTIEREAGDNPEGDIQKAIDFLKAKI